MGRSLLPPAPQAHRPREPGQPAAAARGPPPRRRRRRTGAASKRRCGRGLGAAARAGLRERGAQAAETAAAVEETVAAPGPGVAA